MEPLGADVRAALRRAGGPGGTIAALTDAWPGAVGDEIARNAWPARLQDDGVLVVHARDSVWAFELTQRAAEIAPRLPGSPRLRFVPGPLPEAGADTSVEAPASAARPSVEQEREAAGWSAPIADDELREVVARAAAASLARGTSPPRDDRSV